MGGSPEGDPSLSLRLCERLLEVGGGGWEAAPSLITERSWHGVESYHGELWAIGGDDDASRNLSSCERLDAATDTWALVASSAWLYSVGSYGLSGATTVHPFLRASDLVQTRVGP